MRSVWLLAIALVVVVALWRLGEAHKATCIRQGKLDCSVLPWSGDPGGTGANGGSGHGVIPGISSSVHGVGGNVAGSYGRSAQSIP
jgi:hypothetical protein